MKGEFKGSRVQEFKGSKVQEFKGSRVQGFKDSRVQRFKGSRAQGCSAEADPAASSIRVVCGNQKNRPLRGGIPPSPRLRRPAFDFLRKNIIKQMGAQFCGGGEESARFSLFVFAPCGQLLVDSCWWAVVCGQLLMGKCLWAAAGSCWWSAVGGQFSMGSSSWTAIVGQLLAGSCWRAAVGGQL